MSNTAVSQFAASAGSNEKGVAVRKLISSVHTSLDGYIEGRGGSLDWLTADMDEAAVADDAELLRSVDTILLGRVTYDGFSQFWPSQTGDFADLMNHPSKIVFSRSGEAGPLAWDDFDNAELVVGDPMATVQDLKAAEGDDMVLLASAGLVQSFSALGLIDEYRIYVYPVVLGA